MSPLRLMSGFEHGFLISKEPITSSPALMMLCIAAIAVMTSILTLLEGLKRGREPVKLEPAVQREDLNEHQSSIT